MLVSKPSEGSMQCSKKSYTNRLQIKEIGLLNNYFYIYTFNGNTLLQYIM